MKGSDQDWPSLGAAFIAPVDRPVSSIQSATAHSLFLRSPASVEQVGGQVRYGRIGRTLAGRIEGGGILGRDPAHIAAYPCDHLMLVVVPAGATVAGTGGEDRLAPGSVFLADLMRPFRLVLGSNRPCPIVLVPQLLAAAAGLPVSRLHATALPAHDPLVAVIADHLAAIGTELTELTDAAGAMVERGTLALLRGAAGRRWKDAVAPPPARLLVDIELRLGDHRLNPEQLGMDHGLSRASLYRRFESLDGVSNYIRQRRTVLGLSLLSDMPPDAPLEPVIRTAGFTSERTFARALNQATGQPPRQLLRTIEAHRRAVPLDSADAVLIAEMRAACRLAIEKLN